ncbi:MULTISPECIES: DUF3164 family protein [unclassified Myroides]|uniref:DUF3164 family protein n=1 Tax=unclassified Myroides TaxID=2642485 RepID=UPI003D2F6CC2
MKTVTEMTTEELTKELEKRNEQQRIEREKHRNAYEGLKKESIINLCGIAKHISSDLKDFKKQAFETMQTVYVLLQEYSERHSDSKGNFRIQDGDLRITYRKQGKGFFDERADQAEKHIIDFVNTRFESDADTKDLIFSLLERKKDELDINLIQKLYALEDRFDDNNWTKGIALLKESYSYNHSKDYILFEERDKNGAWKNISLNFAAI